MRRAPSRQQLLLVPHGLNVVRHQYLAATRRRGLPANNDVAASVKLVFSAALSNQRLHSLRTGLRINHQYRAGADILSISKNQGGLSSRSVFCWRDITSLKIHGVGRLISDKHGAAWQAQGKRDEARELLARAYRWFTEGFDTLDLKQAKHCWMSWCVGGRMVERLS